VQQSSGYEMLDRAAQESVRNWRFVPARQGGQPATRWFKVPVTFALKDDDA
jgi:protein TonB